MPHKLDKTFNPDARLQIILAEYKKEGSALSQITKEENALYDAHIATGIPMEQLRTPKVEEDFQKRREKAVENLLVNNPKPMG